MKNAVKQRVVVGMSGGVDSSTSALLLKQAGYDVIGVYLHFWYEATPAERRSMSEDRCSSIDGQADARRVARQIGIPFYTLNFSDIFKTHVVDYFLGSYESGATPNPCVQCNKQVKFGEFISKAQELFDADFVATGHYAQVVEGDGGRLELRKGVDVTKDQTYFLYTLSQEKLARVLFPLGGMRKSEVREIAEENGLVVAKKGESQGLCFLREEQHYAFLQEKLRDRVNAGDIVDENGAVLGSHKGLSMYTKGQRHGLEIGGAGPYYVTGFDYDRNVLYVSNDRFSPLLYTQEIELDEVNVVDGDVLSGRFGVKVRHGAADAFAEVVADGGRVAVRFDEPQRAVMSGQSAVLYDGDRLVGGGVIS